MNEDATSAVMIGLIAIQTTVLLAGVPWAFKVHAAVASLKVQLESLLGKQIIRLENRLDTLEKRVFEID